MPAGVTARAAKHAFQTRASWDTGGFKRAPTGYAGTDYKSAPTWVQVNIINLHIHSLFNVILRDFKQAFVASGINIT